MAIKFKTSFLNRIGVKALPIYLIKNKQNEYDLICKKEIPIIYWAYILKESIEEYELSL